MSELVIPIMVPHMLAVVQVALGIVFLLSTLPKLQHPRAFVQSVIEYRILPSQIATPFAFGLMVAQTFLAVAFLMGWWTAIAAPLAAAVLLAFLVATIINLRRGRRVPCGCFGSPSERISPRSVARLLFLLGGVAMVAAINPTGERIVGLAAAIVTPSARLDMLSTIFLALFLVVMAVWLLSLPELLIVLPGWRSRHPLDAHALGNTGRKAA